MDTEFLEGTQKKRLFGVPYANTKNTIDLISIGIVSENADKYYAISKDFNLKEAWYRHDVKTDWVDGVGKQYRDFWIRDNVLLPVYKDLLKKGGISGDERNNWSFTYKNLKRLIKLYGKTNKEIAKEIEWFVAESVDPDVHPQDFSHPDFAHRHIEFVAYYADYDWVVFCWLWGKMLDLPTGFPMYCIDLMQIIDEVGVDKKLLKKQVSQINAHNALDDAQWVRNAYNYITL